MCIEPSLFELWLDVYGMAGNGNRGRTVPTTIPLSC
jgi:hypothetical protein